jgi:quinol monooxygenase YgiN
MHCVVYEFAVRPGRAAIFEKAWADFTEAIYRVCGSLGSRLHTTDDPLVYVAYAQWPSRETFDQAAAATGYTQIELEARAAVRASTQNVRIVYSLTMHADHLRAVGTRPG